MKEIIIAPQHKVDKHPLIVPVLKMIFSLLTDNDKYSKVSMEYQFIQDLYFYHNIDVFWYPCKPNFMICIYDKLDSILEADFYIEEAVNKNNKFLTIEIRQMDDNIIDKVLSKIIDFARTY